MDFTIPHSMQEHLDALASFVHEQLVPLEPLLLSHQYEPLMARLDELRHQVQDAGWWAPNLPASVGGHFTSLVDLGLVSEVLGQSPLGHYVFGCQAPDAGNAELMHLFGNQQQQDTWLKPLAAGQIRSCFAMTEPHTAGSNPTLLDTQARLEGDYWVINGRKWFTTAADGADLVIVMAVTDSDAAPHQRASMIMVPANTPGYSIIRNIPVMGHAGSGYFSHSEVEFSDCRVPADSLLGPEGQGFRLAQARLGPGRIQHCMRWLGIGQRALDEACRYTRGRRIRRSQMLSDQQIIQSWLAESLAELRAARALVLQTAWRIDREDFSEVKADVSMIKFYTAQVLQRIIDRCLQMHGALGMTDDTIVAFFFREERAARIYDGPDEVHKLSLARAMMKASEQADSNENSTVTGMANG